MVRIDGDLLFGWNHEQHHEFDRVLNEGIVKHLILVLGCSNLIICRVLLILHGIDELFEQHVYEATGNEESFKVCLVFDLLREPIRIFKLVVNVS